MLRTISWGKKAGMEGKSRMKREVVRGEGGGKRGGKGIRGKKGGGKGRRWEERGNEGVGGE